MFDIQRQMWQTAMLTFDAQMVVGLRMCRIWSGGALSRREATRMITEKVAAAGEAQALAATALLTGASTDAVARKINRKYAKRIRANRRRLTR